MNQSEAQTRYKELLAKVKVAERAWPVGMAAGLERLTLKNDLNHFKLECQQQGITLLEPCPFCGSYDVEIHDPKFDEYNEGEFVDCNNCNTRGPHNLNDRTLAIAAWNKRAD